MGLCQDVREIVQVNLESSPYMKRDSLLLWDRSNVYWIRKTSLFSLSCIFIKPLSAQSPSGLRVSELCLLKWKDLKLPGKS